MLECAWRAIGLRSRRAHSLVWHMRSYQSAVSRYVVLREVSETRVRPQPAQVGVAPVHLRWHLVARWRQQHKLAHALPVVLREPWQCVHWYHHDLFGHHLERVAHEALGVVRLLDGKLGEALTTCLDGRSNCERRLASHHDRAAPRVAQEYLRDVREEAHCSAIDRHPGCVGVRVCRR